MFRVLLLFLIIWPRPTPDDPRDLHRYDQIFTAAGIPNALWADFANVAYCESKMDRFAHGDTGSARGLFQIHWYLWGPWAESEGLGSFPYEDWDDPVVNARLAYLIGEHYSIPRGRDRWDQWSAKPWWQACSEWEIDI